MLSLYIFALTLAIFWTAMGAIYSFRIARLKISSSLTYMLFGFASAGRIVVQLYALFIMYLILQFFYDNVLLLGIFLVLENLIEFSAFYGIFRQWSAADRLPNIAHKAILDD